MTADPDLPQPLLAFLDRVARIDGETVRALTAWEGDPDDLTRDLAQRSASRAIDAARLQPAWQEVRNGLRAWATNPRDLAPWPYRYFPAPDLWDVDSMSFRVQALPYLLDAAAALLLADRLRPDEAEALLRPWQDVVG